MARQTRAQRRARRQEQAQGGVVDGARARQQQMRTAAEPAAAARPPRTRGRFIAESWAELKKVEWPTQPQLITGTTVVLIACTICGFYLWLSDLAFRRLVQHVLLGQ
jgi:preprotein translocase subunit SecE